MLTKEDFKDKLDKDGEVIFPDIDFWWLVTNGFIILKVSNSTNFGFGFDGFIRWSASNNPEKFPKLPPKADLVLL